MLVKKIFDFLVSRKIQWVVTQPPLNFSGQQGVPCTKTVTGVSEKRVYKEVAQVIHPLLFQQMQRAGLEKPLALPLGTCV